MSMTAPEYQALAARLAPKSKPWVNVPKAFFTGGCICAIGQGLIVYATPYARYLYYGEIYGPNFPIFEGGELAGFRSPKGKKKHPTGRPLTYRGAPERGAYWFERMKAEHKDDIVQEAAAAAGGKAK